MNWFLNMSTPRKIGIAIGSCLALAVFAAIVGVSSQVTLNCVGVQILRDSAVVSRDITGLQDATKTYRLDQYRLTQAADQDMRNRIESDMTAQAQNTNRFLDEYGAAGSKDRDTVDYTNLKEDWQQYISETASVQDLAGANKPAGALAILNGQGALAADAVDAQLHAIQDSQAKAGDSQTSRLSVCFLIGLFAVIAITLIEVFFGLLVGYNLARIVTAPVTLMAERLESVRSVCMRNIAVAVDALSRGDLTAHVESGTASIDLHTKDEFGAMAASFNGMLDTIRETATAFTRAQIALGELLTQTRDTTEAIAQVSEEVAAGNQDLSQRTEEQASSLEETAASMELMTETVKRNAENAHRANDLAARARSVAEGGGTVVREAVRAMGEINEGSKRIADIISVIDEIAFQTNLLALNAAVEAARVGEQGRGFAVVASEVRSLAGRSATAAKEIKELVLDSVTKVASGGELVNRSGAQLDEIVISVNKVADIVSEIAAASQEQAAGIDQVNRALVQMEQITQQNAALVEEASAASQSMTHRAKGLQAEVAKFRVERRSVLESHIKQKPAAAVAAAATGTHGRTILRKSQRTEPQLHLVDEEKSSGFEEF